MIRHNGILIDARTLSIAIKDRAVSFKALNGKGHQAFKFTKYLLLAGSTGLTREDLFTHMYADDPDGGPLYGFHIYDVMMSQCAHTFHRLGVTLKREKRGGRMYLRLVPHVV